MTAALVKAVAVTAELTGTELSAGAKAAMVADLSEYPEALVLRALTRCRRELRTRLTLAAVLERIDDGRPGAEEAWAMLPKSEADSVVWCEEMAQAFGVAQPLIAQGDIVAARMAFREHYTQAVQRARDERRAPQWSPSYGHDRSGRAQAVRAAVERGRLTAERATRMLASLGPEHVEQHRRALAGPAPVAALLERILLAGGEVSEAGRAALSDLRKRLAGPKREDDAA